MKKRTILILVIAVIALVALGFLWQKTEKGVDISNEKAVQTVRNLSGVKDFEALLAQSGKRAIVEAEDDDTVWNVHVYEIVTKEGDSHTATFGWYRVNKKTGEMEEN